MERSDDQGNERAQMEEAETTKLKQMERNVTGEATQTKAIIEKRKQKFTDRRIFPAANRCDAPGIFQALHSQISFDSKENKQK